MTPASTDRCPPTATRLTLLLLLLSIAVTGCGMAELVSTRQGRPPALDPAQRAVRLVTEGCGHAAGRSGSGIAIGDGLVLTVAHLVARADAIDVSLAGGDDLPAQVVEVDLRRDLALLRVPWPDVPPVALANAEMGAEGLIVGGVASGTVHYRVETVVYLSIEEVLGTARHQRLGYELEASTATGDSGAGVYTEEDQLIGIVFATGEDGQSTWATSSVEIQDFLSLHADGSGAISCDPETSMLAIEPSQVS